MHRNSKRQTRQKRTLARAILSATLILWLTACTSTPKRSNSLVINITPPDPIVDGQSVIQVVYEGEPFTADADGVYMPLWYWEKMFDYVVDTQAALDSINGAEK